MRRKAKKITTTKSEYAPIRPKGTVRRLVVSAPSGSHPAEQHAQIVCGHFGDTGSRESNGAGYRSNCLEVAQTPGRGAIAKVPVESLVARSRCDPFAFVRAIEIERRRR